jgi:hypothetical protein
VLLSKVWEDGSDRKPSPPAKLLAYGYVQLLLVVAIVPLAGGISHGKRATDGKI